MSDERMTDEEWKEILDRHVSVRNCINKFGTGTRANEFLSDAMNDRASLLDEVAALKEMQMEAGAAICMWLLAPSEQREILARQILEVIYSGKEPPEQDAIWYSKAEYDALKEELNNMTASYNVVFVRNHLLKTALEYISKIPGTFTPEQLIEVNGINDGHDRGIRLCGAVETAREALDKFNGPAVDMFATMTNRTVELQSALDEIENETHRWIAELPHSYIETVDDIIRRAKGDNEPNTKGDQKFRDAIRAARLIIKGRGTEVTKEQMDAMHILFGDEDEQTAQQKATL